MLNSLVCITFKCLVRWGISGLPCTNFIIFLKVWGQSAYCGSESARNYLSFIPPPLFIKLPRIYNYCNCEYYYIQLPRAVRQQKKRTITITLLWNSEVPHKITITGYNCFVHLPFTRLWQFQTLFSHALIFARD